MLNKSVGIQSPHIGMVWKFGEWSASSGVVLIMWSWFGITRSHGSLVVKVTDSWHACHEFEPRTTEDPPHRRGRCTLNMSRLKRPRGRPRRLTVVQNYEVRRQ
ncbi:hypothetical protein TNCV_2840871 [Trichonephila clavipes]|uniref:Uncharacterized protein n=1 Tax=Trichonephila clavipes TaxID=2585209 RepID=A0A8X6RYZ0_TRICX|nr:hypothetical protein TNCV_2840871 [Trichonephila clavipes]